MLNLLTTGVYKAKSHDIIGLMSIKATVERWIERENSNHSGFTQAVYEEWERLEPAEPALKPRSLDMTLRRWIEGKANLSKHPMLREALSAVLDVPVGALFPTAGESERGFDELPDLGAFDPNTDEPFAERAIEIIEPTRFHPISTSGRRRSCSFDWFECAPAERPWWIHAPPGAGREFVTRWHEQRAQPRGGHERPVVLRLETLDELSPSWLPKPDVPVVIKVEREAQFTAQRIEWLAARLDRGRKVRAMILAPFAIDDELCSRVFFARWAPSIVWRSNFVRWAVDRLDEDDTTIDPSHFTGWINTFDPKCVINTPADLLTLLLVAHRGNGVKELSKRSPDAIFDSVAETRAGAARDSAIIEAFLRRSGAECLRALLRGWWCAPALPWNEPLAKSAVAPLLREFEQRSIRPTHEQALAAIKRVARKNNPQALKDALAVAESSLTQPTDASDIVDALVAGRLLEQRPHHTLEPAPPLLARLAVDSALPDALAHEDPAVWGRWAVDPTRRQAVDRAIDKLAADAWLSLVRRALRLDAGESLGAIGAIESLFMSAGRRIENGWKPPPGDQATLHDLAKRQLALLVVRSPHNGAAPRTRPGLGESGGARFVAACWDWSFAVSAIHVAPSFAWLFPGWIAPRLDAAPHALNHHDGRWLGRGIDSELDGIERILQLVSSVVERCPDAPRPGQWGWPSWLIAAAIVAAPTRGWSVEPLAEGLSQTFALLGHWIDERVRPLPRETTSMLAHALWKQALLSSDLVRALRWFDLESSTNVDREQTRRIVYPDWMSECFPVEQLCAKLRSGKPWEAGRLSALLACVPDEHGAAVLRAVTSVEGQPIEAIVEAARATGHSASRALEPLTRDERQWIIATHAIWKIDPEFAKERAERDYARGEIHPWIEGTQPGHEHWLLELSQRYPEQPVPAALVPWLARELIEAGPNADALFAVLSRAGWTQLSPVDHGAP